MLLGIELEKVIYHVIRQKPELFDIISYRYFHTKVLGMCYKLDKKYYLQCSKIPKLDQLRTIAKINHIDELTDEDVIGGIFTINIDQYESEWLDKQVDSWIKHRTAELIITDSAMLMQQDTNSENIDDIVENVYEIFRERSGISYQFDEGLDFFNPTHHYQEPGNYFSTGYPFIDEMTGGGHEKGSLICLCGESKIGKSIWGCNLAANSVKLGHNTALVSLEMKGSKIIERIGANLFDIPMASYEDFAANPANVQDYLERLKNTNSNLKALGSLHIKQYPASTASAVDIENYLRRIEEKQKKKLEVVIIDYINIMKNWRNPNTENLYSKVKQIAEDLRAMMTRNEWSGVTFTQLNRDGLGNSNISVKNIAESAGLLHTVDALFGIMMNPGQAGHIRKYRLKALALRNADGAGTEREFVCDFDHMKITEDQNSNISRAGMFDI